MKETWQGIRQAMRQAVKNAQLKAEDISALACIGHGKGLYLLDKNGQEFTRGSCLQMSERSSWLKNLRNG